MSFARSRLSPELIGAALSLVVLAVLVIRIPGRVSGTSEPTPLPSASSGPQASDALSPGVRSSLSAIVVVNGRLAGIAKEIDAELARQARRAGEIAARLPSITAQITAVNASIRVLVADPITADLGTQLDDAYGSLTDLVRTAQKESIQNGPAYFQAGANASKRIAALAPFTARAKAILAGELGSAAPSGGPRPSGAASPPASRAPSPAVSPPPSAPPAESPAPRPSGSAAATLAPGGLIVNGGFETGVANWFLRTATPSAATVSVDTAQHAEGAASARIDIQADSGARSGISLVQGGISLRAGQRYTVQVVVRAAEPRDVRVRVESSVGGTYIARIFPATTAWSAVTFQLDNLVDDASASLAIDVGQSTAPVWVDAVAISDGST